jgi:glycosyltransferase involved in cell wall biosynthesis
MIRALYLANVSCITGGCKRAYEVSKRIKSYGVEYIPATILIEAKEKIRITDLNEQYIIAKKLDLYRFSVPHIQTVINEVVKLASNEGADIIISAHELPTYILTAYLASRKLKMPWSTTLQLPPKNLKTLLGKVFYVNLFKNTTIMSVSYSIAEELWLINYKLRNNVYVFKTPIGVDPEVYKTFPAKEEYDAIYFSRLIKEKGLFDIPLVWRKVVKHMPNARLAIAGPGSTHSLHLFKHLVKTFRLQKNVSYLGFLPKEKLYSILKASKVMIYPSYLDAFPIVVLEALAAGVPVVAYNIPAIKWAYHSTKAVQKVEVGNVGLMADKVLELLENEQLRTDLSIEARKFTSRFTWDNVAAEEAYVVRKLINRGFAQPQVHS